MQLTKEKVLNAKVPSGKVLVELISNKNARRGGIYIPETSSSSCDAIVRSLGDQIDNTYYNLTLEKRLPFNISVGDIVNLKFVSDFYRVKTKDADFAIINPGVIIARYNKDYYTSQLLTS